LKWHSTAIEEYILVTSAEYWFKVSLKKKETDLFLRIAKRLLAINLQERKPSSMQVLDRAQKYMEQKNSILTIINRNVSNGKEFVFVEQNDGKDHKRQFEILFEQCRLTLL